MPKNPRELTGGLQRTDREVFALTQAVGAMQVPFYHAEAFDIDTAFSEDLVLVIPAAMASLVLDLRGRQMRPGLLPAHTHTAGSISGTTDNGGIDHTHTTGSGGDHVHSQPSHTHTTSAHTHTTPSHTHTAAHAHDIDVGGATSPPWKATTTSGAGTTVTNLIATATPTTNGASPTTDGTAPTTDGANPNTNNDGGHNHGSTSAASVYAHGHTFGASAPSISSAGVGGGVANQRPAGVTVTVDGIDRTAALGGAFGATGADWNNVGLDILQYLQGAIVGAHTLLIGCTQMGRLKAVVRGTVA